jgi:hypothetical protein
MEKQKTALYRFFDQAGKLLYVRISKNPVIRMYQHSQKARWYEEVSSSTVKWFRSREYAIDAELEAIRHENPIHNVKHAVQPRTVGAAVWGFSESYILDGVVVLRSPISVSGSKKIMVDFHDDGSFTVDVDADQTSIEADALIQISERIVWARRWYSGPRLPWRGLPVVGEKAA